MKKIIHSLIILSLIAITISSCEVAEPGQPADGSGVITPPTTPGDDTQTGTSKVTFKVDGVNRVGADLDASYDKNLNILSFSCTTKNGAKTKTEALAVVVFDFKGAATTFSVADENILATYITDATSDDEQDFFVGASGNIVIKTITDKVISGTFQFDAVNKNVSTRKITEGTFSIDLSSVEPTTPTDPPVTTPDAGPTTEVSSVSVSFKADNITKTMSGNFANATYNKDNGAFSIGGIGSNLENISIVVFGLKGKASYDVEKQEFAPIYTPDMTDLLANYNGTSGTLVVTDFSAKLIKGTFNFVAKLESGALKTITGGTFVVNFK